MVEPTIGLGAILLGAVGYGEVRSSVRQAHRRLNEMDQKLADNSEKTQEKLEDISQAIADLRVYIEQRLPKPR